MRKAKEKYFLYIGFCIAVLPIILLRDFSSANELRYLSIADEALRNHTFFTFYNHGVPYADKPPLYLWIVMLLRRILGSHQMWALSLISIIPAIVTVKTMDIWTKDEMDAGCRSVARMMLLTSGLFMGLAITLRMDMLMCMFIVLAMRSFWHIYENDNCTRYAEWEFPIYLFLALFTKGPLGVLIPLCSILVFLINEKQLMNYIRIFGWRTLCVLLSGCVLWFCMVYFEGGKSYLENLLFHQTVDRAVNSFHHSRPFYFYFECIWYCIAPWSLFVIGSNIVSLKKNIIKSSMHKFFISSSITTFLLLSCISGKLQVYMLPAIPFLVYSAAIYMARVIESKWSRIAIIVPAILFTLSLPVLLIIANSVDIHCFKKPLLHVAALVMTISGIRSIYLFKCQNEDNYIIERAIKNMGTGLLVAVYIAAFSLPYMNCYIGYGKLCRVALAIAEEKGIDNFTSWDMSHARDMDVYLKRPVRIIPDDSKPMDSIKQKTILFIPAKDKKEFSRFEMNQIGNYAIVAIKK